ncbi:MAG: zinc ribbon domain-containing protein [Puniceicoccaceae bacterium]|nr:MAG: zinc ribbon domain-containing protein [Puniceicoccaceae bacterium]
MPTYEYACRSCDHSFEIFQSMKDEPLSDCPSCRQPQLRRLIGGGAGILFKGSGFYETDYKRPAATGSEGAAKSESKSESKGGTSEGGSSAPAASGGASTASPSSSSKPAASAA